MRVLMPVAIGTVRVIIAVEMRFFDRAGGRLAVYEGRGGRGRGKRRWKAGIRGRGGGRRGERDVGCFGAGFGEPDV